MQGQRFLLKSPVEQLRWSIGQRDPADSSVQLQRAHLLKWSPRCPWADCSCVFACAEGCRCHNSAHLLKGWWVACRSMKRSDWGLGAAKRKRNLWLPEPPTQPHPGVPAPQTFCQQAWWLLMPPWNVLEFHIMSLSLTLHHQPPPEQSHLCDKCLEQ